MSAKLFKECDSWGDSSGYSGEVSFSFKKTPKVKNKKKNGKGKNRNHSEIETDDPGAGKFVRAPKYYGLEDSDGGNQETAPKTKQNKRKRKLEAAENNSSDGITPEKKLKKQTAKGQKDEEQRPTSFGDKLRENLKGSRFRFLNEQMYKQPGKDSMKIFEDDPSAFEAYHEGYRHQISQWPMNPLDRIIKNLKRL